jgi:hypothetical protein
MDEGNENLVYLSPWDFKRFLCAVKSYDMGPSRFTSHAKEGVLRIFVVLKISISLAVLEPATFGSSGKHTNNYTTKATLCNVT